MADRFTRRTHPDVHVLPAANDRVRLTRPGASAVRFRWWAFRWRRRNAGGLPNALLIGHHDAMTEAEDVGPLLNEVARAFAPSRIVCRKDGTDVVADVVGPNGVLAWPDFSRGPSELMAVLAAEQRFLVEQVGSGAAPGTTYVDMAKERLHRWRTQANS
jgi:hypothetical protein